MALECHFHDYKPGEWLASSTGTKSSQLQNPAVKWEAGLCSCKWPALDSKWAWEVSSLGWILLSGKNSFERWSHELEGQAGVQGLLILGLSKVMSISFRYHEHYCFTLCTGIWAGALGTLEITFLLDLCVHYPSAWTWNDHNLIRH